MYHFTSSINTGHDGSLSTGHANSTEDMLNRLETMILQGSINIPLEAIRQQIASYIDIIIHLSRLRDKSRKTMEISEIVEYKDNKIERISDIQISQNNDQRILKYDISNSISLLNLIKNKDRKLDNLDIIEKIINTLINLDNYFINESSIIFNLEYIFYNQKKNLIEFICIPELNKDLKDNEYINLIRNILSFSTYNNLDDNSYIIKIFNKINLENNISKDNLLSFIKSLNNNKNEVVNNEDIQNLKNNNNIDNKNNSVSKVKRKNNKIAKENDSMTFIYLLKNFSFENLKKYRNKENIDNNTKKEEDDNIKDILNINDISKL